MNFICNLKVILIALTCTLIISCKNNYPTEPTVTTAISVSNITSTSVNCGGEVTSNGGAEVTERGICWSTHPNPTITDNKNSDGAGIGVFTSWVTKLTPMTKYYLKAPSTNSFGTSYGEQLSFTTSEGAPPGPPTDADGNIHPK